MSGDLVPSSAASADVQMTALALAAARLALEEKATRPAGHYSREDLETIAEGCVRRAFLQFDVDLADMKSVAEFRQTIDHARNSRLAWKKAGATIWTGFWGAIGAAVLAAVAKFGLPGLTK